MEKIFLSISITDHQFAESLILVFGFYERTKKKDKIKFVTKYLGIIVKIIFM